MKSTTSALVSMTVTLTMMFPASAFATVIQGSTQTGTVPVTGSTSTPTGVGGNSYSPTTFQQPTINKTTGIENNGKDGSGQQGNGSNMAMITMIAMAAVAAATCPACGKRGTCPICASSLLGAAAAGMAGQQMDSAQGLSNTQVTDVNPTAPVPGGNSPTPIENTPEYQGAVKNMKTAAKSIGATVNKDGTQVTMADGEVLDPTKPSEHNNYKPTAAEQGMINSALAKAKADMEGKGADGAASIAAEGEGGEDGGGGSSSGTRTALADEGLGAGSGATGRRPASVAGMSKDFNGTKIGVAQDSLFEMLHRRYQVHNNNNSFIQGQ